MHKVPVALALALAIAAGFGLVILAAPSGRAVAEGSAGGDGLRLEVGNTDGIAIEGRADRPPPETGQRPRYRLFAQRRASEPFRPVGIEAMDAIVDEDTDELAWIDRDGTLWLAPARLAPRGRREVAQDAIPGLAASGGRLAFATRRRGPHTEPWVVDIRSGEVRALDGGDGPDEVLAFDPEGEEVLLLSGRTGVASLFAAGAGGERAQQLTNRGLRPGPELDREVAAPAPASRHDVRWERSGIGFRAQGAVMRLDPERGELRRFDEARSIEEVLR